jgi:hypothetical protein
MRNNGQFHNFFLTERGAHLSIATAVSLGLIAPGPEPDTLIVQGKKVAIAVALEGGIIDAKAAEYLAMLPLSAEASFDLEG